MTLANGSALAHAIAGAALVLSAGCATVQEPYRSHLDAADDSAHACADWLRALDSAVDTQRVSDLGARRISGFPYLRTERFIASFASEVDENAQAFDQWVGRMRALDAESRKVEIANLSGAALTGLGIVDREAANRHVAECAELLTRADLADAQTRVLLTTRARVEDDYSSVKRTLGLYAIVQYPFSNGVEGWHEEARETFRRARTGERPSHPLVRYVPPEAPAYSRDEVAALLKRAADNALRIPEFTRAERARLFDTYAPVFQIETTGDYDRIGSLYWGDSRAPMVDTQRPLVYRKLAYTRVHEETLLQLVYVAWMPERPKKGALDLLGGRLDGIVWRVTLAPDGEPVLFDSIHPCGCFHMFFPTPRVEGRPAPAARIEWAFSPASLPAIPEQRRVLVQAQTRTHYLRDVALDDGGPGSVYEFADYDDLRALPVPSGGTRSVFGPDGLVPGTQRGERYFFWPMGVDSAGAMRQWGTHATAFLGRRHFDDPRLIEQRFDLVR